MKYIELVELYEKISNISGRLDKVSIISEFIKNLNEKELKQIVYLLQGRVFPSYNRSKLGINDRLVIKSLSKVGGKSSKDVEQLLSDIGDLGDVSEKIKNMSSQSLLSKKELTIEKVVDNISNLANTEGKGAVDKKLQLILELISNANAKEAKYIVRTLIGDLRIGIKEGVIRDSIAKAYEKDVEEIQKVNDMINDYGDVAVKAKNNKLNEIEFKLGRPIKVMLAVLFTSIEEAFVSFGERIQVETKLDGFRAIISKDKDKVKIFTRGLEDLSEQFPDVVKVIREIKEEKFMIDSEVVGYDKDTKEYLPFQKISQRIKRKYDIEKISKEYPVEVNVFDVLYYKENLMEKKLEERREILEKIIKEEKGKIVLTKKIITDNEKEIEEFFEESLKKGYEGIMLKNLNSEYKPGRYVKGWSKLKKILEPLDLTIVRGEYGTGKRAGWLTSFTLACKNKEDYLEVGKVGTGIKEKTEGLTYKELTKLLKPLIKREEGKIVELNPGIVIEIGYEEIQKSDSYSSGYALRFPKVLRLREDEKQLNEINTVADVEKIYNSQSKITLHK